MSHVRTQIRNAVVGLLTGLDMTDDRVYVSRTTPLPRESLPALRVFVDEESIEVGTIHGPADLDRTVAIRIDCVSALLETLDDDLDQMALEVETAIAADATLSGLLSGQLLPAGIEVSRSGDSDQNVGVLTLTYQCKYEVESDDPETTLA